MKWLSRCKSLSGTLLLVTGLTVLSSVSGCSTLKAASAAIGLTETASNGIDAEVTVGKKTEEINTEVGRQESNQQAETIENYVDNIPPLVLFILVLGWLMPTPTQMWKGFLRLIGLGGRV